MLRGQIIFLYSLHFIIQTGFCGSWSFFSAGNRPKWLSACFRLPTPELYDNVYTLYMWHCWNKDRLSPLQVKQWC